MTDTPRTDAAWKAEWDAHAKNPNSSPAHGMFDLCETLERELTEARAEWISVKDRLPEEGQSVLTCGRDPDGNWWREICSAGWAAQAGSFCEYWMPLPKPPEGK